MLLSFISECIYGAIVEKLTISKAEISECPLGDVIFAYLEAIDENEKALEIYQYLTQEMLVKHSTACFAYIVNRHWFFCNKCYFSYFKEKDDLLIFNVST